MSIRNFLVCWFIGFVVSISGRISLADESFLPADTTFCIVVNDLQQSIDLFKATSLGQLLESDELKEFKDDMSRQMDEQGMTKYRLGLEWSDITELASGEFTMAYVDQKDTPPALAIVVNVEGNETKTSEVIANASKVLVEQGYTTINAEGLTVFNPPERKPDSEKMERLTTKVFTKQGKFLVVL